MLYLLSVILIFFVCSPTVFALDYTPLYPISGDISGLTLLIDFPDVNCNVSRQNIDNMLNQTGYTGYGNHGSVKDYFYRYSGGTLNYTNKVAEYYTTANNKSYYDSDTSFSDCKERTDGLIEEALQALADSGFDFSTLTVDSNNNVLSFNILYEGNPSYSYRGLWPHAEYNYSYQIGGVNFTCYQLSNIASNDLSIGTFIHETGHALCKWPDIYFQYMGVTYRGTGIFDVMSYNNDKNPQPPNPFLRNIISGWGNAISLNDYAEGSRISVSPNSLDSYMFRKSPDSTDYFMIESINNQQEGYTALPGSGLLIYHVSESGLIPVYLEEADGNSDIKFCLNLGEQDDIFCAGNNDSFGPYTNPNSDDHDAEGTPLYITQINSAGTEFTYHGSFLGKPENLSFANDDSNVKLIWGSVTGASDYEVSIDNNAYASTGLNTFYTLNDTGKHSFKIRTKDTYGRISNATQAIGIKCGDVNSDGLVTFEDKVLTANYTLNPEVNVLTNEQLIAADVDNSGEVDALDCAIILQYASGVISNLPAGRIKLILYGDLNGDGSVTEADIDSSYWNWEVDVLNSQQKIAADVNFNGQVDYEDFGIISRYVSGSNIIYPPED